MCGCCAPAMDHPEVVLVSSARPLPRAHQLSRSSCLLPRCANQNVESPCVFASSDTSQPDSAELALACHSMGRVDCAARASHQQVRTWHQPEYQRPAHPRSRHHASDAFRPSRCSCERASVSSAGAVTSRREVLCAVHHTIVCRNSAGSHVERRGSSRTATRALGTRPCGTDDWRVTSCKSHAALRSSAWLPPSR